jgi:hypothetical protein
MTPFELAKRAGAIYPHTIASLLAATVRAGGDPQQTLETLKVECPHDFMVVAPPRERQHYERNRPKGYTDRILVKVERASNVLPGR